MLYNLEKGVTNYIEMSKNENKLSLFKDGSKY